MKRIGTFLKNEAVLSAAALCALATMVLVPPDRAYLAYIDFRVLGLLFALMTLVEGFRRCGVFRMLTAAMLRRSVSGRVLGLGLAALPFFSAMLVTNDVALLVFVPFTLGLLEDLGCRRAGVPMLVTVVTSVMAKAGVTKSFPEKSIMLGFSSFSRSKAELSGTVAGSSTCIKLIL